MGSPANRLDRWWLSVALGLALALAGPGTASPDRLTEVGRAVERIAEQVSGTGVSPVSSDPGHGRDGHAAVDHGQDAHATFDLVERTRDFYRRLEAQPLIVGRELAPATLEDSRADGRSKLLPYGVPLPYGLIQAGPVVAQAVAYRGVPYRWGGSSPSRGFDCSGLVWRILTKLGLRAPRTAAGLFKLGGSVAKEYLKPGDLVFFQNTYKPGISHVGIYLRGGRFIHASSGSGQVAIGNLGDPYFQRKYAGAKRLAAS